jgi:hypothetical protein
MQQTSERAPRPFSRLETDDELVARIRTLNKFAVRDPYENIDAWAERNQMQRRIVWVVPAEKPEPAPAPMVVKRAAGGRK